MDAKGLAVFRSSGLKFLSRRLREKWHKLKPFCSMAGFEG